MNEEVRITTDVIRAIRPGQTIVYNVPISQALAGRSTAYQVAFKSPQPGIKGYSCILSKGDDGKVIVSPEGRVKLSITAIPKKNDDA